jgi:chromosome segregation ATPase
MSQSDVTCNFRTTETKASQKAGNTTRSSKLSLQTSPRDHATLLLELEQAYTLNQQRLSRIHHLEQALDQALVCLNELRIQLQNQSLLETQLAKTENFANVQQKAVGRLKQRLYQQSQALEAQAIEIQTRDQALSELQKSLDVSQQLVAQLEVQLQAEQGEKAELTTQIEQAKEQLQEMSDRLHSNQAKLNQLEQELAQIHTDLDDHQNLTLVLRRTQDIAAERYASMAALQKDLAIAQIKVEELESQLAKQIKLQARWQQDRQEAEAEKLNNQARMKALEQQNIEMQEQIFQHARQAEEYEAAVQYWKDRCLANQHQLAYFKELAVRVTVAESSEVREGLAIAPSPELLELLNAIQMLAPSENMPDSALSEPVPSVRLASRLDIPDFLMRRRTYRASK